MFFFGIILLAAMYESSGYYHFSFAKGLDNVSSKMRINLRPSRAKEFPEGPENLKVKPLSRIRFGYAVL